jgi:hypothetical protein
MQNMQKISRGTQVLIDCDWNSDSWEIVEWIFIYRHSGCLYTNLKFLNIFTKVIENPTNCCVLLTGTISYKTQNISQHLQWLL